MDTVSEQFGNAVSPPSTQEPRARERMNAKRMTDSSVPLRERLLEFAMEQGPLTLVFFAAMAGVFYKGDAILQRIEAGYERNARELLRVTEEHTRSTDAVIKQWKEDRVLLVEILRRDNGLLRKNGMLDGDADTGH